MSSTRRVVTGEQRRGNFHLIRYSTDSLQLFHTATPVTTSSRFRPDEDHGLQVLSLADVSRYDRTHMLEPLLEAVQELFLHRATNRHHRALPLSLPSLTADSFAQLPTFLSGAETLATFLGLNSLARDFTEQDRTELLCSSVPLNQRATASFTMEQYATFLLPTRDALTFRKREQVETYFALCRLNFGDGNLGQARRGMNVPTEGDVRLAPLVAQFHSASLNSITAEQFRDWVAMTRPTGMSGAPPRAQHWVLQRLAAGQSPARMYQYGGTLPGVLAQAHFYLTVEELNFLRAHLDRHPSSVIGATYAHSQRFNLSHVLPRLIVELGVERVELLLEEMLQAGVLILNERDSFVRGKSPIPAQEFYRRCMTLLDPDVRTMPPPFAIIFTGLESRMMGSND